MELLKVYAFFEVLAENNEHAARLVSKDAGLENITELDFIKDFVITEVTE